MFLYALLRSFGWKQIDAFTNDRFVNPDYPTHDIQLTRDGWEHRDSARIASVSNTLVAKGKDDALETYLDILAFHAKRKKESPSSRLKTGVVVTNKGNESEGPVLKASMYCGDMHTDDFTFHFRDESNENDYIPSHVSMPIPWGWFQKMTPIEAAKYGADFGAFFSS